MFKNIYTNIQNTSFKELGRKLIEENAEIFIWVVYIHTTLGNSCLRALEERLIGHSGQDWGFQGQVIQVLMAPPLNLWISGWYEITEDCWAMCFWNLAHLHPSHTEIALEIVILLGCISRWELGPSIISGSTCPCRTSNLSLFIWHLLSLALCFSYLLSKPVACRPNGQQSCNSER